MLYAQRRALPPRSAAQIQLCMHTRYMPPLSAYKKDWGHGVTKDDHGSGEMRLGHDSWRPTYLPSRPTEFYPSHPFSSLSRATRPRQACDAGKHSSALYEALDRPSSAISKQTYDKKTRRNVAAIPDDVLPV